MKYIVALAVLLSLSCKDDTTLADWELEIRAEVEEVAHVVATERFWGKISSVICFHDQPGYKVNNDWFTACYATEAKYSTGSVIHILHCDDNRCF